MVSRVFHDRWPEIDALFAQALDQPAERRGAFLAEVCGDDAPMFDTLSELIAASERPEEEFSGPGDGLLREAFTSPAESEAAPVRGPGEGIGRYRLIRELGRGGMATVYEAERADGTYEQRVAVKLLLKGVDNPEMARRFQIETQVLSTLSHPNIARLLDAGTTDDGHLFLVMELVIGEPITEWADRRRLDVDARLDLFVQVADAVAFAHKHLVVHRDLKPSNVMVGHDGQVKLLDFGIAKLLEAEGSSDTRTRPTTRWMTPGYAAPEQVLGKDITTAADVHGMGVLLYELLAGQRPFGGDGLSGFDLNKAICEQLPTRPSSVVAGAAAIAQARDTGSERLRRRLSGDLDAIVAKALRKDPEERYASVRAMARDIERHRTGFPVEARAGLRAYSARRFLRRHRLAVGAIAAIVLVLTVSSVLLSRQQLATAAARDRAASEAANAGLVIDFLADVFRGRDPQLAPADTLTARDLLAWGSERVETEFADRPALQAELLAVLGSAYSNLGLTRQAVEHFARSVELSRVAHGDRSEEVAERLINLSAAYRAHRDPGAAVPLAREALAIRRATLDPMDPAVADALQELAVVHSERNQADSAAALLGEALDIYRTGVSADDPRYVHALVDLAQVRRMQGDLEDAAQLYEEAVPKLRRMGDNSLALPLNNYAFLLRTLGEFARAEPIYREGLEISTRLYGRGHPRSLLLANNLAAVLHELGDERGAEVLLRENVAAAHAQWPDGDWRVGAEHAALGRMLLRDHQWDDAFEQLREAHAVYSRFLGADHLWTYFIEATLAAGHVARGRADLGQPYLDRFYQYRADNLPDPNDRAAQQSLTQLVIPFVNVLEDLDLQSEADRFRSLIAPRTSASDGGRR
jgi:tetratricopeptide (TPR) repeat protein/tRNA A-37 threonylcarbamoyl transferase component Bud32